jgi:glucosamine--fructose-6-phosphate aminotransferase (isomerizing)
MSLMLDEIHQQPAAIERTIKRESKKIEVFAAGLKAARPRLIVLVARGSSDNAAIFGRYVIEMTTGIPVSLAAPAIHTLYKTRMDLRGALVVGISQSGEGPDINLTLENSKRCGATTLAITNEAESSMAKLADETFLIHAGRERSVAATKTYTGQLLAFYLLAYALGAPIDLDDLRRLPGHVETALSLKADIEDLSERYTFMNHAVVVARGLNYSNAFEFALKMMETCYVVAERFSSADLLHGPIAMVEHSFPSFVFAPSGVAWPGLQETLQKLENLRAETLVITDRSNQEAARSAKQTICLPVELPELYTPIPYIVPAQLFAAHLSEHKGFNPDEPRTLSKVTKTL